MDIYQRKVPQEVHDQVAAKIKAAGGFKAYLAKAKQEGRHFQPPEYSLEHLISKK